MKYPWLLILQIAICNACHAENKSIRFDLPIACDIGTSCFIQNYVDTDPSPEYLDYTCGFLSYNDHKGTDFRLPSMKNFQDNIKVLAAADGTVRATRDEMPDININDIDPTLVENKEAGNSVAIRHGDGWETQYSHLKLGSIKVKAGDKVVAGQVLGYVGLSGNTEFPHLHFTVRHFNRIIDPFTGNTMGSECGQTNGESLWNKNAAEVLRYQPTGILEAGFTDNISKVRPMHEYIEKNFSLPAHADRIIFWVHIFGAQKDDIQKLSLMAPSGKIIATREETITENQARRIIFLGKKLRRESWPEGIYRGNYILIRNKDGNGSEIINKVFDLSIDTSEVNPGNQD